MPLADTGE